MKKKPFLEEKRWNYFLPVFKAPPKNGCKFLALFCFLHAFSVSSASNKRAFKKNSFIGFFDTLLKHLVTSCSNNHLNPEPPPKKVHHLFSETPLFDQKQPFKTQNVHHPLKTVHSKNSKKTLFYRLEKVAKLLTYRWPSY